jgi:hypothetical protein
MPLEIHRDGNTISSGGLSYVYDFENHLVQQGGASFVYDGDGNPRRSQPAGALPKLPKLGSPPLSMLP